MNTVLELDPLLPHDTRDKFRRAVVVRVTDFDEDATGKFSDDLNAAHETGQTIIPVVIDSYGGDPYALLGMIAAIDAARLPVATIVEGKAISCGAMLFSLGASGHRYIAPTATLMFHDITTFTMDDRKTAEVKADAQEMDRLQDLLFERMAGNVGKPKTFFHQLLDDNKHADVYMTAKDAKKHGIATHVGLPSHTTRVQITHVFGVDDSAKTAVHSKRR